MCCKAGTGEDRIAVNTQTKTFKRPEIVAPAGDLDRLCVALHYGADAVYLAGTRFGLRRSAGNFGREQLKWAVDYAHSLGRRVYVAANIMALNQDLEDLEEYFFELACIKPDAVIISDPGVFFLARKLLGGIALHISTQASCLLACECGFWKEQGASRVVLGRELSLGEIADIKRSTGIGVEIFVHGAMCVSISGKCVLSNYLAGRDANRGGCVQTCRRDFSTDPEQELYALNSKDLCGLEILPEIVESGADALKIEGRMKSSMYLAHAVGTYRRVLDLLEGGNKVDYENFMDNIKGVSNRGFTHANFKSEGFDGSLNRGFGADSGYFRFSGIVKEILDDSMALVDVRFPFKKDDMLDVFSAKTAMGIEFKVDGLTDTCGNSVDAARANASALVRVPAGTQVFDIIRMRA